MKHVAPFLLLAALLAGCGGVPSPTATRLAALGAAAMATDHAPILGKPSTGLKKKAAPLPEPEPVRQGLTKNDVPNVAKAVYAEAFAAKTPAEAIATAKLGYTKLKAMLPARAPQQAIVKFAEEAMKAEVNDPENQRRIALWPLHYLKQGVAGVQDPLFFEMTAIMMESMLNWQDGLALGLVTLDYLEDHPDGYVKTMAAKAFAKFRSPKVTLEESFKITKETLKEIQSTMEVLKK